MTNLLLKLFVKNKNDVKNPLVREKVGSLSGIVCIVLNILLATAKILVGLLFGIVSVKADGLNNLTDCGSNIISLVSVKMANKPADKEHPYGHARIEYVASMIVSFLVLMLAFELGSESVDKIFHPEAVDFANIWWVVGALVASIVIKFWMFIFNRKLGKTYNSELMVATSTDSISDCISTFAVLVATLINYFTDGALPWLDGVMGVAVALFIAFAGIKIFFETLGDLLGRAPDMELIDEIVARVKKFDGVLGIHDLNVHNYGPDRYYASVHVEVDSEVPVLESHDMIDQIEKDFKDNTNIVMVIHMDPIVVGDEELDFYREKITAKVLELDSEFNVHDFRIVRGETHTNLIFDIAVPYDVKMTDTEIHDVIQDYAVTLNKDIRVVATVEKQIQH